jgi:single-stranded-DNA-specific exonuclease
MEAVPDQVATPAGAELPGVRLCRRSGEVAGAPLPILPADLLRRLYLARGSTSGGGATLPLSDLHPASALRGVDAAAEVLANQVRSGGHILVVGDYDADGATGSALAVRGLRALGAARVSSLIPSRFAFGYGLSPAVVEAALPLDPDLILTVDNGIASIAGVDRANQAGVPVVVTDHHLPGAELPHAAAIVNPNQPGCPFPSKHLAGVGVMFYLLAALRARLRDLGWFSAGRREPNLAAFLDLVAQGTVADVVTLDENNRILVEQGLQRIRAGRCCPGVRALIAVAGRDPDRATARDLGFAAAPRLNAAGRLTDMALGVECLLADDLDLALDIARRLDGLNRERRSIEGEMREDAEAMVDALRLDGPGLPAGLCLFGADWHQGVTGIVAARMRERYQRPTIAFGDAGDGRLRGSARSVEAVNIRDLIDTVDKAHPGLIERFGGHAMAAGLTLPAGHLDAFAAAFAAAARAQLGDRPPVRELVSDGELPPACLNLEVAESLRTAGPWGKGFPEPLFDGIFEVTERRLVGEGHLRLNLRPVGGAAGAGSIQGIGFRLGEAMAEAQGLVHLAYRLDVNEYRGVRAPQLLLEYLRSAT